MARFDEVSDRNKIHNLDLKSKHEITDMSQNNSIIIKSRASEAGIEG